MLLAERGELPRGDRRIVDGAAPSADGGPAANRSATDRRGVAVRGANAIPRRPLLVAVCRRNILLHANADTLGYLFAAQGLGSLVGALTMTIAGGFLLEPRRIVMGSLLFAGMELVFLVMPGFGQAIVLLLVIGWSFAVYSISTNTFVQVRSPDRMQGRMVSLYSMLFIGVTPIGNIWAGLVAHLFGPSAAVWMGGALTGVAGLAVLGYFLSRRPSRG
ncbi:MAG: MFS transporter [Chloroflexi bacterium]|nr:MAG: MFS transporter [Chloroflexota bacterium]